MNFVDSFVTLFLLTLLYLSAVKSAHLPKEGEIAHERVISFMEVYNRSICRPRELLVEILKDYPAEVEHLYIPSCVVLRRCAGCCNDEMQECTPTSTHNITMEIKRYHPNKLESNIFMSFTEHSACDCSLKKEAKEQRQNRCLPCCDGCSDRRRRLFVQDPLTCRCSCRHSEDACRARNQELNERTCKCDQPRR